MWVVPSNNRHSEQIIVVLIQSVIFIFKCLLCVHVRYLMHFIIVIILLWVAIIMGAVDDTSFANVCSLGDRLVEVA